MANQNILLIEDDGIARIAAEKCIQCGTCSASCPLNRYMDYTPRQIVALVREGLVEEALKTKTIWLCSTCYLCAVRCPAKINIGEFMTALKRFALKNGYSNSLLYPKLMKTYVEYVNKYGRVSEPRLMVSFSLKTNPLKLLKMLPISIRLLKNGELSISLEKVQNLEEIKF
ncbi:MAG: 4Fe-4S dicluster domain-containing protein [Nitrososphaerota archaeon]